MKKMIILLLVSGSVYAQDISKQRLDSLVVSHKDQASNIVKESKTEFVYDVEGKHIAQVEYAYNTTKWDTTDKARIYYDERGNDTLYHGLRWDKWKAKWVDRIWDINKYDVNNAFIYHIHIDSLIGNFAKTEYAYDAQGRVVSEDLYEWNDTWHKIRRMRYEYTSSTNIYMYWNGISGWRMIRKIVRNTNTIGLPIEEIEYIPLNGDSTTLENLYKNVYEYDAENNLKQSLTFYWSKGVWADYSRDLFEYDSKKNQIAYEAYGWTPPATELSKRYKLDRVFNNTYVKNDLILPKQYRMLYHTDDSLRHMVLREVLIGYTITSNAEVLREYYYSPALLTYASDASLPEAAIYPNPAETYLNVNGYAEICTLTGNTLLKGLHKIDVSELNTGVYIVKCKGTVQKFLKR